MGGGGWGGRGAEEVTRLKAHSFGGTSQLGMWQIVGFKVLSQLGSGGHDHTYGLLITHSSL